MNAVRAADELRDLERHWQETWRRDQKFRTSKNSAGRPSTYVYACTPFTTGRAHMGHVRSYTLADVLARRARQRGHDVLWAMGFDAFGLPNEMAAMRNGIEPKDWVRRSQAEMTAQFQRLGLSLDWSRVFLTSDPSYYRWTQWVFLRFFERGLVHRREGVESWCPQCSAVLADLQVEDGCCWRCGTQVELTTLNQWYLTFQPFAEELTRTVQELSGWDPYIAGVLRGMLSKVNGQELLAHLAPDEPFAVFARHPRHLSDATFVALSPWHPLASKLSFRGGDPPLVEVRQKAGVRSSKRVSQLPVARALQTAWVPGLGRRLPVVVTPLVDRRFGGGAAFGQPAQDEEDALTARTTGIQELPTFGAAHVPGAAPAWRVPLRDYSVSRQRGWGAPVPVIHCDECGTVPVPDEDLPVLLPGKLDLKERGAPLAAHPSFADCRCPRCGAQARRDTDTLDVHVDSLWMLVPFCIPPQDRGHAMFDHPELTRWLPVHHVVCGRDQAAWWLNDLLFFAVMRDLGYFAEVQTAQPIRNLLAHDMVLAGDRKMSKSLGNIVEPNDVILRYSADALRLSVLSVRTHKAMEWSEDLVKSRQLFLDSLWQLARQLVEGPAEDCDDPEAAGLRLRLSKWSEQARVRADEAFARNAFHRVIDAEMRHFALIRRFLAARTARGGLCRVDVAAAREAVLSLLQDIEPLAPHIACSIRDWYSRNPGATSPAHPDSGDGSRAEADVRECSCAERGSYANT